MDMDMVLKVKQPWVMHFLFVFHSFFLFVIFFQVVEC